MAFCSKCGREIANGSQFCSGCGQPVSEQAAQQAIYQSQQVYQQPMQSVPYPQQGSNPMFLLQQLCSKIKTNSIIWIVIACVQFFIGMVNIVIGFALNADYEDGTTNLITGFFVIIVGVLNIVNATRSLKYSREVLTKPVGIVQSFQPVGNLIGTLIYNLLLGGIIGVAGSIYAFILRSFVLSNTAQFQLIEAEYRKKSA